MLESESIFSISLELFKMILSRDTLHDGLEEIQLYLACLRWARGYGSLDFTDNDQFKFKKEDVSESSFAELKEAL